MARKRGENLSFPLEVETEAQWAALLKREGLIVADVYSGWSGPCTSMFTILRKLKLDTNDDRLILAAANADNITQLAPFRNQSEPCWLFMGVRKFYYDHSLSTQFAIPVSLYRFQFFPFPFQQQAYLIIVLKLSVGP